MTRKRIVIRGWFPSGAFGLLDHVPGNSAEWRTYDDFPWSWRGLQRAARRLQWHFDEYHQSNGSEAVCKAHILAGEHELNSWTASQIAQSWKETKDFNKAVTAYNEMCARVAAWEREEQKAAMSEIEHVYGES